MAPTPLTDTERRLTRRLTLTVLDPDATPADQARHLTHLAGSQDAALRLLNEAEDEARQHIASVALLLRTNRI